MNSKFLFIAILSLFFVSCGVNKRKQAEQIISEFQHKNIPYKQEAVFDIYANFKNGRLILKGEIDNLSTKDELLNALKSFKFTDEIVVLPDSTVGENTFGLVNLSAANLRVSPKHSAELVTQALLGTPVKILKKENGWYFVQTPDNYISWIDPSGIFPVSEIRLNNWHKSKRIIFNQDFGLVYESEKLENPVSDVTLGNILEELERTWRTVKVKFPNGRIGFVESKDWINFDEFKKSSQPNPEPVILLANKFIGRPYLWGGTSCKAMDCSGFVKTVYFMNGIILARDASLQIRHGESIETTNGFEQLNQGDLLFFGRKENEGQSEKVTHVALSLGGTEYIHASGLVKLNSFNTESKIYSEHRKNSFLKAKRILGSEGSEGVQRIINHPWY